MSVNLNLPTDLEETARAMAMASGEDVESFLIRQLSVSLRRQSDGRPASGSSVETLRDSLADRLARWTALHPIVGHVDDSRESIYAGRE